MNEHARLWLESDRAEARHTMVCWLSVLVGASVVIAAVGWLGGVL